MRYLNHDVREKRTLVLRVAAFRTVKHVGLESLFVKLYVRSKACKKAMRSVTVVTLHKVREAVV